MATILAIKKDGSEFEFPEANLANVRRLHSAEIKEFILEGTTEWNKHFGIVETKVNESSNEENDLDVKSKGRPKK